MKGGIAGEWDHPFLGGPPFVENPMELQWTVPPGRAMMLRSFIRGRCGLSASLWKRIKWHGTVQVNGTDVHNAKMIVSAGDVVRCCWSEENEIVPADIPLSIVHEDEWLLLVNKGPGMIIHPTHKDIHDSLVNAVAGYFQKRAVEAGIHPLYRLDRNTTGLVLVAKSAKVQYDLSHSHDQIVRHYIAFSAGHLPEQQGLIDAPIGRKPGSIVEWMVRKDGKEARTAYTVLARGDDFDVLRLRLYTGRTHQIRVHMAYLGHPLLGDDFYGGPAGRMKRQALHAEDLSFRHPVTGELLHFTAPLPEDMKALLPAGEKEGER